MKHSSIILPEFFMCKGDEITEELTTFVYEDHGQVVVVRNVPGYVCKQCGEKLYTDETTDKLVNLLRQPPQPTEILHVPAYDFVAG